MHNPCLIAMLTSVQIGDLSLVVSAPLLFVVLSIGVKIPVEWVRRSGLPPSRAVSLRFPSTIWRSPRSSKALSETRSHLLDLPYSQK